MFYVNLYERFPFLFHSAIQCQNLYFYVFIIRVLTVNIQVYQCNIGK